ncbi:MAG TPA: hypothetical protein VN861_03375 [Candidatus Acidoferrales bacterium]|nr:hypothetical protein [Candidatus Acidoferrales bacterium]
MLATISSWMLRLPDAGGGDLIHFLVGFLILCCVIACVIILVKWLCGLMGVTIPPPLMAVLGIILFIILLLMLLNYSGYYRF